MKLLLGALLLLISCIVTDTARADKRVALVIGNSDYENTTTLRNPRNDAADMSALLKKHGFSVVEGIDLDKRKMERAIRDFGVKLAGADLALFFYAGHGLQVNGKNYVVPIDARLSVEGDLDFEVLELGLVLKQMEREANTRVVLLDACRDNPLVRSLRRSMGPTRSTQLGQGLAKVERTQVGTLIGYATDPGSVANDGEGRNSPYTQALLKHLDVAGRDLATALSAVRGEVLKSTNGQQVPWEHTSLLGPVFIRQEVAKLEKAAAPPPVKVDSSAEIAFWNSVQDSKVSIELETYLDRYPNGTYAALARLRIDGLKQAEAARKAAESSKVANLPPKADAATLPATAPFDTLALTRSLQKELARVGCDPGAIDGRWSKKATDALDDFARLTKSSVAKDHPSQEALSAVLEHKGRVCPLACGPNEIVQAGKCVAKGKHEPRQVERRAPPAKSSGESKPAKEPLCWSSTGMYVIPCSDPRADQSRKMY